MTVENFFLFGWSWPEVSVLGSQVFGQASIESCDHAVQKGCQLFTESSPMQIVTMFVCCFVFCLPLGVTFNWIGIKTFSQIDSSFDKPNTNHVFIVFARFYLFILFYQSPSLLQPHHQTSWDFHSS